MDATTLRALQAPLKQKYRDKPDSARIVARAAGGDLTLADYLAGRNGSKAEWIDDTARSLYRTAGVMAAAVWFVSARIETLPGAGTAMFAVKAFVPISVGAAVYLATARLFGVDEARGVSRLLRRR